MVGRVNGQRGRSGSGLRGRSVVWLGLLVVGLAYATITGRWSMLFYLLLRAA